jgi:hypothetical protein
MSKKGSQMLPPITLSYRCFLVLRFVFAPWRPATTLGRRRSGCHPKRRTAAPLSPTAREPFKDDYRFLDLLAFLA